MELMSFGTGSWLLTSIQYGHMPRTCRKHAMSWAFQSALATLYIDTDGKARASNG
jgi:hypothetical protein